MKLNLKKSKFSYTKAINFLVNLGANTISQVFVLFVALITINVISQKYFLRIDLTATKTYTLSEGTRNILNSLDDTVTIKTFFSENVPPDLIPIIQDVHDTYDEYVRYSNGKIKLEIQNPKDEDFEDKALDAGVPEVQYQGYTQDKYEIAQGFLGAAITYKDQIEVIELITEQNIQNLEYETSSRIFQLTHAEKIKVGFLTGHGERSIASNYSTINKHLNRQFSVQTIDLSEGEPIDPNQIRVLVIAAPSTPLSERDQFEIDQYIMNGGRVVFLADPYQLDLQSPILSKTQTNFSEFIRHYGVEVTEAVILDESYMPLYGLFPYPYWVVALNENFSTDNPALSQLQSLVFLWASPVNEAKTNEEQNFSTLIQTTQDSWLELGDTISVEPSKTFMVTGKRQMTIACIMEGKQVSLFKGKDIPELESQDDEDEAVEDKRTNKNVRSDEIEDAKIVVIGDSDFIDNDFIEGSDQNPVFFSNLIEWLSNSNDLIAIRSKNIDYRPLKTSTESSRFFIKAINIVLVPIFLIGLGIAYNLIRKKRRSLI